MPFVFPQDREILSSWLKKENRPPIDDSHYVSESDYHRWCLSRQRAGSALNDKS
jgi:hypothetical protein